jgi:iron(III) transport system permease protein
VLAAIAVVSVATLLVPPVFLVIRAGFGDAWNVIARTATAGLIGRTLLLAFLVGVGAILVGVPMAWLVVRTRIPGARWWAAGCSLPLAIPSFVAALSLLGAFGPKGFLQQILEPVGVNRLPDIYGLPGATLALVMATFPYVFLLAVAALRTIDPSVEEAARSLGRRPLGVFFAVTFPQIRRAVVGGVLISGLYVISDYGAVSLMRYDTLTPAIFNRNKTSFDRAPAAVLGLLLIALTVLFLVLEHQARGKRTSYRLGAGAGRGSRLVALRRWTPVALGFSSMVIGFFVAIPVAVLIYWIGRARSNNQHLEVPWDAATNTLFVALISALVVTLLAVPVSVLARRYRRGWTMGLERSAYASNALPGVVVGLALVFVGARYVPWLYQTLPLLLVGYLIRYFAQALTGVDTALAAVNPHAEEAARGLGRSPLRVLTSVTLPLMRPGLISGATLVFLSVLKELPVTLFLRPTGFDTLGTVVWSKAGVGAYGQAAVPALMLLIIALPFLYLAAQDGSGRGAAETLPAVAAA